MVMATDIVDAGQSKYEMTVDPGALHERLVEHVRVVSGEQTAQAGVWGEHSYARPRGAAADPLIRTLLAPRPASPEDCDTLDVDGRPDSPPSPLSPLVHARASDTEDTRGDDPGDDDDDDDWETRLATLAPTPGHARLATVVAHTLTALRLETLAGRGRGGGWQRRDGARAAAHKVRRALAPHWAGGAPAWLHGAVTSVLPPSLRPHYEDLLAELWRTVPRLASRLGAPRPPPAAGDPLAAVGDRRPASEPGPWLAWAPSGSGAEDARWARRLGSLLHVRELVPAPPSAPDLAPDRWCASLAHEARTALAELLAEAGRRPVLLGGAGGGAALCSWLAAGGAGARVRGLVLLAPPLLTAEGPREAGEEPEPALLVVCGGAGSSCCRSAAAELCVRAGCSGPGGGRGARAGCRRVLVVAGADDRLWLPRPLRRSLRVPQQAVDAAVAEECARWCLDVAESPPKERSRRKVCEDDRGTQTSRSIEIVEGRVVQRGTGGVALELAPPRRARRLEPADDTLAAADIMQLPIVFADDEPAAPPAPPAPLAPSAPPALTVTSGHPRAVRYTRVIVAKRPGRRRAQHEP